MLSLKSPRWQSLSQAYGPATDIPGTIEYLQDMSEDARADAWGEIWAALCHQGTVYTATYAAIPHLVDLAARAGVADESRVNALVFIGAVASSTDAAPIPSDLLDDYRAALVDAVPLVTATLEANPSSVDTVIYLLQALAALHGCVRTSELFDGFANGEFIPRCPAERCGVEMYVTIEGSTMFASLGDPATQQIRERTEVVPPVASARLHVGAWNDRDVLPLLVDAATRAGHPDLARLLELWDGSVTCPKCREPFGLRAALLDPTGML